MDGSVSQSHQRAGLRLALLALAQFIIAIDYNIVFVALPDIGDALGFSPQTLQWVVSSYAVAFGGFLLFGGRAADRLGARRVFVIALVLFGVSALVGGLANSPEVLVLARAVQGLGGALLFPSTLTLIVTSFAEGRERNRALAVWGSTGSGGLAAGALLGGVLTGSLGWAWVFFSMVPLVVIALIGAPLLLAPDAPRSGDRGGFDVPGALVVTVGATLVVFGLVSGPEAGWTAPRALGSLVVGALLIASFFLIEAKTSAPLAPLRMFGNRSLITSMLVAFLHMSALSGGYYLFTTYIQNILGYDALQAGLAFLPLGLLAMIAGGKVAASMLNKSGLRTTLFIGMLVYGIGMAAMAAGMSTGGTYWSVLPGVAIYGFGGGLAFTTIFATAGSGVDASEQGVASALASTAQQVGAAVGLAALIVIANSGLDVSAGAATPAVADVVDGLRAAGWVAAGAAVLGALVALNLKKAPSSTAVPADEGREVTVSS
ncbi:MFS transporter [Streptomyces sp. NPDC019443]|uniref:MFS transporter n=1 Tax=Streptomyces sp. NPDC019443 TaxID=3365061 RepID=UPI0037AC2311